VAPPVEADFSVLVSEELELSLVAMPGKVAATVVISTPPERRTALPIKLAFEVESLEGLRSAVIAAGGWMDPLESAWELRGHRHPDCLDPEGNVVQLRQRVLER
jgi:hypothetical protein